MVWIYRILLFVLLFGVSALSHGGNTLSPFLDKLTNVVALIGIPALVVCYLHYPTFFKVMAWPMLLGVVLLVLESKYLYGTWMYSYFVIKRFFYSGLAMVTYYVATQARPFKLKYANWLIFSFYLINQIFLGQIFSYSLTSESRTVTAPEALYLTIPFLYYMITYLREHRLSDFFKSVLTFALIVFLLHRSVISAAGAAAFLLVVFGLFGKITEQALPLGKTFGTFLVMLGLLAPAVTLLPEAKTQAFLDNVGGILDPKEDETGSWRLEQSEFYLSKIPDRLLLGWRYEGYDRGEIMENEDFPEKGTIIHSQYIDMLYNYGAVGLFLNMLLIVGTLVVMYRRNEVFTTEQSTLFGFLISGLFFSISYQLPVYFWGFVGLAMYYALYPNESEDFESPSEPELVILSEETINSQPV
ncbi:O-antigen ligase family protein [Siphonobacter curvatus]|uniref:O-antigen ligase domain-containing protein n=1 Tax=Siphonobacter curvatus TaxID=2094562 RepID=A0A2S7IGA4_9BACT|nr:O-antigen ligase family protein [Siphonobacter curvatus]PQA54428.1 hypothetical protein C5O19_22015 [Siphonobacter curvatus]